MKIYDWEQEELDLMNEDLAFLDALDTFEDYVIVEPLTKDEEDELFGPESTQYNDEDTAMLADNLGWS